MRWIVRWTVRWTVEGKMKVVGGSWEGWATREMTASAGCWKAAWAL